MPSLPSHYPELSNQGLAAIHQVDAYDQQGTKQQISIAGETPLTIKIDGKELVTLMTLGAHPELLVLGYLRNQNIFNDIEDIQSIYVNWDREVAEVTTTSGFVAINPHSQDTLVNQITDKLRRDPLPAPVLKQSEIYQIVQRVKGVNNTYRAAGSVHGCGLCHNGEILNFIEDVGRHAAMDTISGQMWLNGDLGESKVFYSTGRLTSEIVMKSALMRIPTLISRNGTTQMGFELAKQLGVTLISRAKSRHFVALNDRGCIQFDA